MEKYQKQFPTGVRIMFSSVLLVVVILCAIICIADALSHMGDSSSVLSVVSAICMTAIAFAGLVYPILQDIRSICEGGKNPLEFEWKKEIPFVDREELLEEVLTEIANKIINNGNYLQKYMRYAVSNGKKSFALKLCIQLERLKYKSEKLSYFPAQAAAQIGNIRLVQHFSSDDDRGLELHLKKSFPILRGKKNIIVVQNYSGEPLTGLDRLTEHNILLVILNFTSKAEDVLQFPNDKIVALISKITPDPHYESLFHGKSEQELQDIAVKLGRLSGNNIGEIIKLLTNNEFAMLLETDREFLEFYALIKQAKYQEAEEKYGELSLVPQDKPLLQYKREYEHANLLHFLGKYSQALDELDSLMTHMTTVDSASLSEAWGQMIYYDAVLLRSHTLKHQGRFDKAADTLEKISERQRDLNWIKYHFSVNIFQLNEMDSSSPHWGALLLDLKTMMDTFFSNRKLIDSDYYFYEAYYPIVEFYSSNFDHQVIPGLIQMEDAAIQYYEEHERRFVTNCYFIKAEFLRILGHWEEARKFYGYCYDIYRYNGDKDILYLVAITCKCVEMFDGIQMEIGCDFDKAIEACEQEQDYGFHRRLISKMELAKHDPEVRKEWLPHYRSTINPIP